jgi:hypothetical protein
MPRIAFFIILLIAVALVAGPPAAKSRCTIRPPENTPQSELAKLARIDGEKAQALALASLSVSKGVTVAESGLEVEKGCLVWSLDLKLPYKPGMVEVQIDAGSGKVLKQTYESPKKEAAKKAGAAKPAP